MSIFGATGVGKSVMLYNLALADILNGCGITFIDPHSDNATRLIDAIPPNRIKDVIYLDPLAKRVPTFNPFRQVPPLNRGTLASEITMLFRPLFPDTWGESRMQYYLTNAIRLLLDNPVIYDKVDKTYRPASLIHLAHVFNDSDFRARLLEKCTDEVVEGVWTEYGEKKPKEQKEIAGPIDNKIGQFTTDPIIRDIVTRPSTLDFRRIMDERKILICNLSDAIGEIPARLLGGMIISAIKQAAMSRIDIPSTERQPHYLFIDEFERFTNETFCAILSEARKYGLHLILGSQYLKQLDPEVQSAILGNVGNIVVFRVGPEDAPMFAKLLTQQSAPVHDEQLINMPNFEAYARIVNETGPETYTIRTVPPDVRTGSTDAVLRWSAANYSLAR